MGVGDHGGSIGMFGAGGLGADPDHRRKSGVILDTVVLDTVIRGCGVGIGGGVNRAIDESIGRGQCVRGVENRGRQ